MSCPPLPTAGNYDLFAVTRRPEIKRWVALLAPRLAALASRRGAFGVTAFDTRNLAVEAGLTTGHEANQRALSWFAHVPRAARLVRTDRTRTNGHRNAQRIFIAPEFA